MIRIVRLTRSQQMALIDILIEHIRKNETQEYIDVSREVTTTPGELLALISSDSEMEAEPVAIEVPWT